jgi:hypothetical protein
MKRLLAVMATLAVLAGSGASFAVSDGNYRTSRNHCTGSDNNSDNPKYVNPNCKSLIMTLTDKTGHEYIGAGTRQTPDGTNANTLDVWFDPGQGTKTTWTIDKGGLHGPTMTPSPSKGNPATGLFLYFGADDNLDGGEHDSSNYVNNGPSDGGGMQYNIDPATAMTWVAALQAQDAATLLSNPTPLFNGGMGACADGFCMSLSSTRRVAFQGGKKNKHRDAANYAGKTWDPYDCAGPSDTAQYCSDATHHHWNIGKWAAQEGTVYIEPGFQIYEDPDPQGSPGVISLVGLPQKDPYPLPAFYIGTCGVIVGGGPAKFPASPNTNSAGQFVIPTACK